MGDSRLQSRVRAMGALGSSGFRYEARPKGNIVDPPEALEFDLFVKSLAFLSA